MKPAGSNFPGIQYNDKKIDKGKGELMLMKNFPSFINFGLNWNSALETGGVLVSDEVKIAGELQYLKA